MFIRLILRNFSSSFLFTYLPTFMSLLVLSCLFIFACLSGCLYFCVNHSCGNIVLTDITTCSSMFVSYSESLSSYDVLSFRICSYVSSVNYAYIPLLVNTQRSTHACFLACMSLVCGLFPIILVSTVQQT